MIRLYFETPQQEIPMSMVNELTFTSSIYSILPTAKVILKNTALQLFNLIKTGSVFYVDFTEDKQLYRNAMKVSSYSKIPGTQSAFSDVLEVNLVHKSFFQDTVKTKAWSPAGSKGGTVSEIVKMVLDSSFPRDFKLTDIEITGDRPAIRYQVGERSLNFLMRLNQYAYKENLPTYMFVDATNTFHLKCVRNAMNTTAKYNLLAVNAELNKTKPSDSGSRENILLKNFKFGADTSASSADIISRFTTAHFKSTSEIVAKTSFIGSESYSMQTDSPTPPVEYIYDWSYTPADAVALAAKRSFEANGTAFTLAANIDGASPMKTSPGTLLRVILPYMPIKNSINGKKLNLGEGNYIVEKQIISFKNNVEITKLKLILVASK